MINLNELYQTIVLLICCLIYFVVSNIINACWNKKIKEKQKLLKNNYQFKKIILNSFITSFWIEMITGVGLSIVSVFYTLDSIIYLEDNFTNNPTEIKTILILITTIWCFITMLVLIVNILVTFHIYQKISKPE